MATDATICLAPVPEARDQLLQLLTLYRQGLREPLHFFPETALAWCAAKEEQRDAQARQAWLGGFKQRGECEDPGYALALRGREPLDEKFRALAATVYPPLLAAREEG